MALEGLKVAGPLEENNSPGIQVILLALGQMPSETSRHQFYATHTNFICKMNS